jgi:predicted dithiol-disulfide oxidoreductase (DUF899 family)
MTGSEQATVDTVAGPRRVVSAEEWLEARRALLVREKELTRARDALNAERRRIGMVRVEKDYVFEGANGRASLVDLFEDRGQLVVQHFMFDPSWTDGCQSCSWAADEISAGRLRHLHDWDTTFAAVSRAPFPSIDGYRTRRGWTFPWYSSHGSDFNYDLGVTFDEGRDAAVYNYTTRDELERAGADLSNQPVELPGLSCFLRDGDTVYHTYSTYARGTEMVGGSHYIVDLTTLGRRHAFEQRDG